MVGDIVSLVYTHPPGPPREAQQIVPIKLTAADELDLARNSRVVGGQRLSLLPGIDPNASNVRLVSDATAITRVLPH